MQMHRSIFVTLFLLVTGLCIAQEVVLKKVPVVYVRPPDGEHMYASYCASCHGPDARGGGPAVRALRTRPVDLTSLARRNHGEYPALHVAQTLRADGSQPAHNKKEMPEWGVVFRSLNPGGDHTDPTFLMRIASLNNYIKLLQTN
jgi:hypothetical protein